MTSKLFLGLALFLTLCQSAAHARPRELADIDRYCVNVRNELSAATPFIFSGPDPWTELDEVPAEMPDDAIAYVFTQGPSVRWVFLRIVNQEAGWQEDVEYYFRENGAIAKRVRRLSSAAANVELDETTYYQFGDILKQETHHHPLVKGAKATADLSDPDAPAYMNVDDLPFPDIPDLWEHLA